MFWNDPKLYSANMPAHYNMPPNYFMPNREFPGYHQTFLPWQQFSRYMPFENTLPTHPAYPQFDYPRFDYPRFDHTRCDYPQFDYPTNYAPFMGYGYMDRPQFPFHKPFVW